MENKTSRYLKYAIGEIFLVVIGILMALQINNWNEKRLITQMETELLQSCKEGLLQDLADIDSNIATHQSAIRAADELLELLATQRPYNIDTVSLLFSKVMLYTRFVYSTSAFETMKAKGVNIVSDKDLRNNIIKVYDSDYNFFLSNESTFVSTIDRGIADIFNTRFEAAYEYDLSKPGYPGYLKPLDFEVLKTDQEFLYYLRTLKNHTLVFEQFHYKKLRTSVVELLEKLKEELDRRGVT